LADRTCRDGPGQAAHRARLRPRLGARQILWEWQLAGLSEAAEVIVSELVTNAMLTSRRQGRLFIRLILTHSQGELAILVRDYCTGIPQAGTAGADDENGRRLLLVQAMSSRVRLVPARRRHPRQGRLGRFVQLRTAKAGVRSRQRGSWGIRPAGRAGKDRRLAFRLAVWL
jgi:anti-sigma regulatory factor (Ser/Thr protein kinase)